MTDFFVSAIAFIVAIGVLVSVHEFGHFLVARGLGFKVLRYSVGFGRPLARWHGAGPDHTEYWLSSIPLGGYVKLLDEREGPVAPEERHRAFNRRPIPQRVAVLLAGPGFNFLFAVIAYWAMFVSGVPGVRPIIGGVADGSVAAQSGLQANDEIVSVAGRQTATWEDAILAILDQVLEGGRIDLTVRKPGGSSQRVELDVRGRQEELTEPNNLLSGLGIEPGPLLAPVIGEVTPGMAAAQAGMRQGDRVLTAGGQPIRTWTQFVEFVRQRPNETVPVTVQRGGDRVDLTLHIGEAAGDGAQIGRIGAALNTDFAASIAERARAEQRYGIAAALPRAADKTWEMSALTVRMLVRMVVGDVSIRNISGPLNIAAYAGVSARAGLSSFLGFLSIVSISLGILNLLPVPLLDGGQVAYQIAEGIKGAPLSERAMAFGQQVGLLLLLVLMGFAFYNDLTRMFG
jgi:regulator of sigma E protease